MTEPPPRGSGGPAGGAGDDGVARRRQLTVGVVVAAALVAAITLALELQGPPSPRSAAAPPDRFSAERAMAHVRVLAAHPRPPGTPAHRRARRYLRARLRALGFTPEVQQQRLMFPRGRMVGSVNLRNVMVRIPGRDPTGAVALMTHYDSRWRTPGAGDAASAVAALLEALRALAPDLPLRNDLVVLFTDAEEIALLGARAFAEGHPWMEDLSFVVNLEARGSAGPSLMFETGGAPGRAVDVLGAADSRPVTSSLFDLVYRRLPNDTDFTVFRSAGKPGLNFAFIRGAETYHTPLDTPARLSRASLQHQGEHALGLARTLGGADLSSAGDGQPVFFTVPGLGLVRYPGWGAVLLAALLALGTLAALGYGRATGQVSGPALAAGLVAAPVAVALGAGAAWLLRDAALSLHPEDGWLVAKQLYREAGYLGAGVCATTALVFGVFGGLRRWFGAASLCLGAVIWPVFLAVGTSLNLPAASYLLAWPAAGGLALAAWELRGAGTGSREGEAGVLLAFSLPVVAVAAPAVREFLAALSLDALAPLVGGAGVFVLCLLPLMRVLGRPNRWWFPSAAAGAAVTFAAWTLFPVGGPDGPENAPLLYATDVDEGAAWWATARDTGNRWVDRFVPPVPGAESTRRFPSALYSVGSSRPYRAAEAPVAELSGAGLSRASESPGEDGRRRLRIRVRRPAAGTLPGPVLAVGVTPVGDSGARLVGVDGREVPGDPGRSWVYREFGSSSASTILTLDAPAGEAVRLRATLYLQGLPAVPGGPDARRPGGFMGSPMVDGRRALTDLTLVRSRAAF